ncbi:MAG TPA: ABC transporter permease [Candidatus Dormibacteraeota bacterium]|nr:ABC transporter permease [Candidatus Dormibacteraeota bacterium]
MTDSGTTADYSRVTGFVVRRLLSVLPLVWGTATLVFLLVEAAPGVPFDSLREPGVSPRTAIRLHEAFGADRPFLDRYVDWLEGLLHGDFGTSWSYRQPAAGLIREAALNTLTLAGPALILQFALGLAAGFAAARSRGGFADRGMSAAAAALYSVPSFCLALPLTWLLAVRLRWLPVSQMHSLDAATLSALPRLLDTVRHLVLPCLALVLPTAAGIALYVRDQVRAALDLGFVSAARARGLGWRQAELRHALRAALLPVVALFGLAIPGILGGSVAIEVLFAWPGLGRLAYQAVLARDTPLILGCTCVASLLVVAGGLLADLLSAALDPRAREAQA